MWHCFREHLSIWATSCDRGATPRVAYALFCWAHTFCGFCFCCCCFVQALGGNWLRNLCLFVWKFNFLCVSFIVYSSIFFCLFILSFLRQTIRLCNYPKPLYGVISDTSHIIFSILNKVVLLIHPCVLIT